MSNLFWKTGMVYWFIGRSIALFLLLVCGEIYLYPSQVPAFINGWLHLLFCLFRLGFYFFRGVRRLSLVLFFCVTCPGVYPISFPLEICHFFLFWWVPLLLEFPFFLWVWLVYRLAAPLGVPPLNWGTSTNQGFKKSGKLCRPFAAELVDITLSLSPPLHGYFSFFRIIIFLGTCLTFDCSCLCHD